MSFLSPLWLLVGVLAAFVLLLHAQRRRKLVVSSTIFFAKLANVHASQPVLKWPKISLPLVLQVVAILLCALALARPVLDAESADKHLIYLLDNSASMQVTDAADGRSRFEAAVDAIAEQVEALDDAGGHQLTLIEMGAVTEPLAVRFETKADFLSRLSQVQPQLGGVRLDDVSRYLSSIVRVDERVETLLFSDNQELTEYQTQNFGFGEERVENASIFATVAAGDELGQWLVNGAVDYNSAQRPSEVRKYFKPEGGRSFIDLGIYPLRGLRTLGEETKTLNFTDEVRLPGPGVLKLSLPGDAAAFDDEILLAIAPQAADVRVLYLGKDNDALSLALAALDNLLVERSEVLPDNVDGYDIVIVDNAVLPRAPKTNTIWLGAARVANEAAPEFVSLTKDVAWNSDHILSRGLAWGELHASSSHLVAADSAATTLLATNAGALIAAATKPWGREVRIGLATSGSMSGSAILPILLNRFIDWTGARTPSVSSCAIGEVCALPMSALTGAVIGPNHAPVFTPILPTEGIVPDAVSAGFIPKTAGIYMLADGREVVVNATRFEPLARTLADGGSARNSIWPLWRWFILAAIIVLLLEALVVGLRNDGALRNAFSAKGKTARSKQLGLSVARLGVLGALAAGLYILPGPSLVERHRAIVLHNATDADCSAAPTMLAHACFRENSGQEEIAAERIDDALTLALASLAPQQSASLTLDWPVSASEPMPLNRVAQLLEQGAEINVLPQTDAVPERAFAYLDLPEPIRAGDRFAVAAHVFSAAARTSTLTLKRNGSVLGSQTLDLPKGWLRVSFDLIEAEAGSNLFELEWTSADDESAASVAIAHRVDIAPAPSVAIISPHEQWASVLAKALEVQNLAPEIITPNAAPDDIEAWLQFDAVVLLNTPAIALSTAQQEQLEAFVRIHGGGLLLLGGENSFGPGGYYRTPLEDLSPLSAHVPEERPVVALAFVLDRSGSMQADVGGLSRLEIAKQATLGAVDLLSDDSQVSIVVFDSEGHIVSPLVAKNMPVLEAALSTVTPGGGTFFTPGLELGLEQLQRSDAPKRHMILMTDGVSQPGDFVGFAKAAFDDGISLSVVAIGTGTGSASDGLASIAQEGGGAFHRTDDFRALPSILSQEALMLDSDAMVAGVQPVRWVERNAPFLQGLSGSLPPVQGFVKTSLKPGATLHLEALDAEGKERPVLASWLHGNGKVVGFATHGIGEGTAHWLNDATLPLLWGQAIRQSAQKLRSEPSLSLRQDNDEIEIISSDGIGAVRLTVDGGASSEIALHPQGDGTSIAKIFARPGHYEIAALGETETISAISVSPLTNPLWATANAELLPELTLGRMLTFEELPAAQWGVGFKPLWREWVLVGLALLMAELAMRYSPGVFARGFRWRKLKSADVTA